MQEEMFNVKVKEIYFFQIGFSFSKKLEQGNIKFLNF